MEMFSIVEVETKVIKSDDSQVTVFFSLPGRDWSRLSRSHHWKAVEKFLHRKKKVHSQRRPPRVEEDKKVR